MCSPPFEQKMTILQNRFIAARPKRTGQKQGFFHSVFPPIHPRRKRL